MLEKLAERLEAQQGYAEVIASLAAGHAAALGGVWGSSCALVTANLLQHAPSTLVVVLPRAGDVDDFCDDLAVFSSTRPEKFPAWETAPGDRDIQDEAHGDRLRVLKILAELKSSKSVDSPFPIPHSPFAASKLIVTSIQALLQPVPSPATCWPRKPTV